MGKRRTIAITIFALLTTVGLSVYLIHPKQPTYNDRTLTEWMEQYNYDMLRFRTSNPDAPQISNSVTAIRAIGTNGIPTLLKMMQAQDLPGLKRLETIVHHLGWAGFRITSSRHKQRLVILTLNLLGKEARPAAPALFQLMKTGPAESTWEIPYILQFIEPPKEMALPVMTSLLHSPNRDMRRAVATY